MYVSHRHREELANIDKSMFLELLALKTKMKAQCLDYKIS